MVFENIVDSSAGSPSNSPLKPKGENWIEFAVISVIIAGFVHRDNHELDLAPSFFRGRAGEGALHALK